MEIPKATLLEHVAHPRDYLTEEILLVLGGLGLKPEAMYKIADSYDRAAMRRYLVGLLSTKTPESDTGRGQYIYK